MCKVKLSVHKTYQGKRKSENALCGGVSVKRLLTKQRLVFLPYYSKRFIKDQRVNNRFRKNLSSGHCSEDFFVHFIRNMILIDTHNILWYFWVWVI